MTDIPSLLKVHGDKIGEVKFSSNVAGTTFVKNSKSILKFLKDRVHRQNIILRLVREPENEYDSNAVRVEVSIKGSKKFGKIGYIPKDRAEILSYVLNLPDKYMVNVYNINLVGGDYGRDNIGIFFDYNITLKE